MSFLSRLRQNNQSSAKPDSKTRPSKPGLIGLDLGVHSLHLCQLKPEADNLYTIVAKSSIDYDGSRDELLENPKQFKRLLQQAVKGKKFKGRKVTAIMPPDDVKIMLLTYNAKIRDVEAEIVRMLRQRIEGNLDDYVIDYLPVRNNQSDDEHIVMASLARQDKVERFLNAMTYAGLEVHSLDIGPSALKRLIGALYTRDRTSNVLTINIGEDTSYLTIVSGRRLLFDQQVSFGCNQLLKEISNTLDIPLEKARELVFLHGIDSGEGHWIPDGLGGDKAVSATLLEIIKPAFRKLVEEINRMLVYTASETHGEPLSRVYLLGCIARWPGAQDLMMSFLDISPIPSQIEFYQIFLDDNEKTEPWANMLPEMAIATGLALRGIQGNG
ncbi:MAG: pilus assembly protein PilM [Gammaproteobacteria bacterium]|nr:pilus assembly protein PilM [Gammaproteobacteria bacterium]